MGRSDVAVNDFQDSSLDVVYIDACHAFECVDKDIQMWRQKLKPGGLLSGHDFCVNKKERKLEKYKSIAPWCGIYKSEYAVMSNGADSESAKMKKLAMQRAGKEVISQHGSVDAVVKNIGIGNFSVTFEGRKSLDANENDIQGNPSWYSFIE